MLRPPLSRPAHLLSLPLALFTLAGCGGGVATLEKLDDTASEQPDPGPDGFEDASGLAGAVGALEWYALQGEYWEEGSESFGSAWFGLIEPRQVDYWDVFGGEIDGCVNGPAFPPVQVLDIGVERSSLLAGDVNVELQRAPDGFFDAPISRRQFQAATDYDLVVDEEAQTGPFEVLSALRTPQAPTVLQPNFYQDSAPRRAIDALVLEWEPVDVDAMLVLVERIGADGEVRETVACLPENDGSFQVPEAIWQEGWVQGQWVHVYLGAANQGRGQIPFNNADSRAVGVYWALGAVMAQ